MTVGDTEMYFNYDASGTPLSIVYNGTSYYYVTNLQGDVVGIVNQSGNQIVGYTYDAWGNVLTTTGSSANTIGKNNPLRYRGYVYDTETKLYYLQSRYYNPEWGRFINADGLVSTGQGLLGNNMFAYCGNNPVNCSDHSGKVAVSSAVMIGAGVAGGLLGLWSYLGSTPDPTVEGALLAISSGAASAVVGVYAGPADDLSKLLFSAISGTISALSSAYTAWERGASSDEIFTAFLSSFGSGTVTTYLGSYLDTSMFTGFEEGASTWYMTLFSGYFSTPLSFIFENCVDPYVEALSYAPDFKTNYYVASRKIGGSHGDPYAVTSIG